MGGDASLFVEDFNRGIRDPDIHLPLDVFIGNGVIHAVQLPASTPPAHSGSAEAVSIDYIDLRIIPVPVANHGSLTMIRNEDLGNAAEIFKHMNVGGDPRSLLLTSCHPVISISQRTLFV